MEIQTAADSKENLDENGPMAVTLTANTPQERKALALLVETCVAQFSYQMESDSTEKPDADPTAH